MIARIASIAFVLFAATSGYGKCQVDNSDQVKPVNPISEEEAINQLKGIYSNLQKNRDGTVRFVRFSKSSVTNEHVAKTAAFHNIDYLAVVTPKVTDSGLSHVGSLTNLEVFNLFSNNFDGAIPAAICSLRNEPGSLQDLSADCEKDNFSCHCCTRCF